MKEFWEQRYAEEGYSYGIAPNVFLALQRHRFTPMDKILVVGDGEGRNGVWLAQQGFQVTTVDYAQAGINKALALAARKRTELDAICADLITWNWPLASYDRIVSIFLHFASSERPLVHRRMFEALAPGGLIIMEAFNKNQLEYHSGGPHDADLLYSEAQLREDFAGMDFKLLEEDVVLLNEGEHHQGQAAVVRMIARKV